MAKDESHHGQFYTSVELDSLSEETGQFEYSIPWVTTGTEVLEDQDELCINAVSFSTESISYTGWSYMRGQASTGVPSRPGTSKSTTIVPIPEVLCKHKGESRKVNEDNSTSPADYVDMNMGDQVDTGFTRYEYPYDKVIGAVEIYFQMGSSIKDDAVKIAPSVDWKLNFPNWELADTKTQGSRLEFELRRSYTIRVLTPVLLICLLFFILTIPFIEGLGDVAQVVTGIIFGLWGTRQLLIPSSINWPTLLDSLFMILYVALAIMTFVRLLIAPIILNLLGVETSGTERNGTGLENASVRERLPARQSEKTKRRK